MVLDDGSSVGGLSDDAPDSDSDKYFPSDSSSSTVTIAVDGSKLPKPFPILGPLLGYNIQTTGKIVHKRMEHIMKMLGRPMTEDEVNAIAYWSARGVAIASWGPPLGIAGGALRTYQTRDTFRFPFYKPNLEKFTPQTWPSSKLILFSGSRAVTAWHATRLLAYGALGTFIGRLFLASYAISVTAMGEYTDPRLKNYMEAIKKLATRGRLPTDPQRPGNGGTAQGKETSTIWKARRQEGDDNAKFDDEEYGDTSPGDNLSVFVDAIVPDPNTTPHERVTRMSRETHSNDSDLTRPQLEKQPNNYPAIPEDSLPASREELDSAVKAGGSAWERLRQQASGQPTGSRDSNRPVWQAPEGGPRYDRRASRTDSLRQPRERPVHGESGSYSKSEEERQLARDEAQKDFDARVEQERRGGDFSAGNGDQKRW